MTKRLGRCAWVRVGGAGDTWSKRQLQCIISFAKVAGGRGLPAEALFSVSCKELLALILTERGRGLKTQVRSQP